jgi:hypothetical protein
VFYLLWYTSKYLNPLEEKMADYSQPTAPRIGAAYNSKDALTGTADVTSIEVVKNTKATAINVYSSVTAGVAAQGAMKGSIFANAAGSIILYKLNGTSVTIS